MTTGRICPRQIVWTMTKHNIETTARSVVDAILQEGSSSRTSPAASAPAAPTSADLVGSVGEVHSLTHSLTTRSACWPLPSPTTLDSEYS